MMNTTGGNKVNEQDKAAEQVRNQALEEAARLCDAKYAARVESGHPREASTARSLAEAIRALSAPVTPAAATLPAQDAREELRDMLEDARLELSMIREALWVTNEPHQTLRERTLEAARRAALSQQDSGDDQDRLFVLLCEIRAACGDNGKRMQPELVEYIREIAEDAARYQLLRRGQRWSVINGIGDTLRADELDAAIDAARQSDSKETDHGN